MLATDKRPSSCLPRNMPRAVVGLRAGKDCKVTVCTWKTQCRDCEAGGLPCSRMQTIASVFSCTSVSAADAAQIAKSDILEESIGRELS